MRVIGSFMRFTTSRHTSPNFWLIRVGLLLLIMALVYAWCRWGAGQWDSARWCNSANIAAVYWVHIEFVYGRFSIMPKRAKDIRSASFGLLAIFLAMLLLSLARTRLKGRGVNCSTVAAPAGTRVSLAGAAGSAFSANFKPMTQRWCACGGSSP